MTASLSKQKAYGVIFVTGLGFFIDSFDAFSFNVTRVPSLTDLGLAGDILTRAGMFILNTQIIGLLTGGLFWGLLGDKIGRKKAVLGSIFAYSVGMIASSFSQNVDAYAAARFFVGFGIAGEVGLGAALVAEILTKSQRTFGLACFTALGLLGVAAAAFGSEFISWRHLYLMGGIAGFIVLLLRSWLFESALFLAIKGKNSFLQPIREIFSSKILIMRYIACVLILAPNFFIAGFLLTLSPELAKAAGITVPVKAGIMMGWYFIVATFGDFFGAALTHYTKSRKKAIIVFLLGSIAVTLCYLFGRMNSPAEFYIVGAAFGLFNIWALCATTTVEQFPTHLRATVSTSVMNLARATVLIFNFSLLALKPSLGVIPAVAIIGSSIFILSLISAILMRETYHVDLDNIKP